VRVDNEVAKAKNVEVKKISTLKSINKKTLKKDIQEKEHFLKKIKTNENGLKFFRE